MPMRIRTLATFDAPCARFAFAAAMPGSARLFALCLAFALAFAPVSLSAQQAQPGGPQTGASGQAESKQPSVPAPAPTPKEPEKRPEQRRIPVFIDHKGGDDVGLRFAFLLKERINASSLFRLSTQPNEKRIRLRITTIEEFKERPWIGSTYAVVWLFAENAEVLSYYLESDAGVVAPANAAETAERLLTRTDAIAGQFSYLFE